MTTIYKTTDTFSLVEISSIEIIISDAKAGKMYILVDDEDRENEGDLIIPSKFADANNVNFMATHGRGLICITITGERADELNISLQPRLNNEPYGTAFTSSVEAREGVTTGISAPDRARTIEVISNGKYDSKDIVTPGHMFPLIAHPAGVLERIGHTEASVDISVLAGLSPSSVICEIMNENGTMARLPQILKFAKKHNLNVGTIADLVQYRQKNQHRNNK